MIEFEVSKWLTNREKSRIKHIYKCVMNAKYIEEIQAYEKEIQRIIKKAWLRKEINNENK